MFQYKDNFTPTITDSINIGIIYNRIEDPTKNYMCVDDNLLVDT